MQTASVCLQMDISLPRQSTICRAGEHCILHGTDHLVSSLKSGLTAVPCTSFPCAAKCVCCAGTVHTCWLVPASQVLPWAPSCRLPAGYSCLSEGATRAFTFTACGEAPLRQGADLPCADCSSAQPLQHSLACLKSPAMELGQWPLTCVRIMCHGQKHAQVHAPVEVLTSAACQPHSIYLSSMLEIFPH